MLFAEQVSDSEEGKPNKVKEGAVPVSAVTFAVAVHVSGRLVRRGRRQERLLGLILRHAVK